jgi:2-octaprenylphenol hydroxylase
VLLIGDAARAIHPLAGLGANVGFEDVRDVVANTEVLPADADLGAAELWQTFARQRRARAQMMLALMTGLRRTYAARGPVSGWLRNLGVNWLEQSEPLKQQFIREALGLGPLAQGLGPLAARLDPLAKALGPFVRRW